MYTSQLEIQSLSAEIITCITAERAQSLLHGKIPFERAREKLHAGVCPTLLFSHFPTRLCNVADYRLPGQKKKTIYPTRTDVDTLIVSILGTIGTCL